jgi:hypothetical protein
LPLSFVLEIINEAFSEFQLAPPSCIIISIKMDAVWSPSFFPHEKNRVGMEPNVFLYGEAH